jgi:hypothetical protein
VIRASMRFSIPDVVDFGDPHHRPRPIGVTGGEVNRIEGRADRFWAGLV